MEDMLAKMVVWTFLGEKNCTQSWANHMHQHRPSSVLANCPYHRLRRVVILHKFYAIMVGGFACKNGLLAPSGPNK